MVNLFDDPAHVLAGMSVAAQRLRTQVQRVAPHYRAVLLVGEPGCLKGHVARALHRYSPLRDAPFQVYREQQSSDAIFDLTVPLTLYVSEVERLTPENQRDLLRKLRRTVGGGRPELRLICSNNSSPRGLIAAGRLSPELYQRIGAVEIRIAPLRERIEDLAAMLQGLPLQPCVVERLREHHWPGNLREVQDLIAHCLERAGSAPIGLEHLPELAARPVKAKADLRLDAVLRRHVTTVLEACAGNKLRAAEMLGISRSTLYRMLESHGEAERTL